MIGRKLNVMVSGGVEVPCYAHDGDAGLDLRITRGVTLEPGERATVSTGVAVEVPSGCVGLVFPRSGLASKKGITLVNSVGVIDSGYRGEIGACLLNAGRDTVSLCKGDRVCQLVIVPFVPCTLVPADSLSETERGRDGFGSTGIG